MGAEEALDVDQVLDLMHNGFTREGACHAVAVSHGFPEWDSPYMLRLYAAPEVVAAPEVE